MNEKENVIDIKMAMIAAVSEALKYKDKNNATNEEVIRYIMKEASRILTNVD